MAQPLSRAEYQALSWDEKSMAAIRRPCVRCGIEYHFPPHRLICVSCEGQGPQ